MMEDDDDLRDFISNQDAKTTEFLKWKLERRTKTRKGNAGEKPRVYSTIAYATKDAR